MNIDLVLGSLQAIFISLYGVVGIVRSDTHRKKRWVAVVLTYLAVTILCLSFRDDVKGNIQLILFLLLLLDYLFRLLGFSLKPKRLLIDCALTFLSGYLLSFEVENMLAWAAALLVSGVSFVLVKKWKDWFVDAQAYFQRAGTLLTVLFMLEPLFSGIQQNLKPIAAIPITSIVNQQNFLLLGALLALVLGGFFWKEKSRS